MAATKAPALRLGATADDGISATIFALLERGMQRRPLLAREMRGRIELRFDEEISPVRIEFDDDGVVVEDGGWDEPDLVVAGRLPHIVHLTTAPTVGGFPNPVTRHGRAALARISRRHVGIEGDRGLGRQLLRLLEL